ncbi:MAG: DUF2384 domain-containing protein [Chitinophagaceae bacterium]|nr:DUF2384 domain-containing protein [Chitinophagaceae bacterium]
MPKKYPNAEEVLATSLASEPAVLFESSGRRENYLSLAEKMRVVRSGISKRDLESLKAKTSMDYSELAKALSVTRATLINKKKGDRFGLSLSEKILDIADLYAYGFEVFGQEDAFRRWMDTPNQALDFQKPIDFLDNQFGREEIRNLIGRIDYGVYS